MSMKISRSLRIGSPIVGGTSSAVLFVDLNGLLAEDATNFTWDDTNDILSVPAIQFDTSASPPASEGLLHWNDNDKTLNLHMPGGTVIQQLGQEIFLPGRAKNETGATITNGSLVFISGASGSKATVTLADASTEATSSKTIGMATEDIADNGLGHVTTFGIVRELDTSGFSGGDMLWLSETAGEFTNVKPSSPLHAVFIGNVLSVSATVGTICLKIINGFELFELHDVNDSLSSPADDEFLVWNSANSLWEQKKVVITDTEANILATANSAGQLGFSTDTNFWFVDDGTNWYRAELKLLSESANPDMGFTQASSRQGYTESYITDKSLYTVRLLSHPGTPQDGSIRVDTSVSPINFDLWANSQWNDILFDIDFDTASELEHTPLTEIIDVWSGNSNIFGLNGQPLIQRYKMSMGAFQFPTVIDGGSF